MKNSPSYSCNSIMLFVLVLILACKVEKFKCDNWEYKLVHDLLEGYDSSIRPSLHHNMTLNVTFGLALAQLIDVDERNMIITTNCWLNQGWIDFKLKWDPKNYDGIESIHIPAERVWKPDILLVNNADSWAKISSISTNAMIRYNGNVTWLSTVIFKSSCSINVRYFPFDEQMCDMIFASWTFDGFFLDINVNSKEGDLTNYIKNGEWHLVKLMAWKNLKIYSCCEEPYPEIFYRLVIRRRPLYYVFNMVFPCLLITLVAFLGFYLPPGSTDKISIGITTLLSITVFLMLVAESMPPTSEQLPLLGIYYAVTIGIVSFSTAMAVVTLNINNKGSKGRKVPAVLRFIFLDIIAKILRTDITNYIKKPPLKRPKRSKTSNQNSSDINIRAYDTLLDRQRQNNNNIQTTAFANSKKTEDYDNLVVQNSADVMVDKNDKSYTKNILSCSNYQMNQGQSRMKRDDSLLLKACSDVSMQQKSENKLLIKPNDYSKRNKGNNTKKKLGEFAIFTSDMRDNNNNSNNNPLVWHQYGQQLSSSNNYQNNNKFEPLNILPSSISPIDNLNANEQKFLNANELSPEFLVDLERIFDRNFGPMINQIVRTLENNELEKLNQEELEEIQNEWTQVALVADHFLCYFFPLMTIFLCLMIFFYSPHVLSNW